MQSARQHSTAESHSKAADAHGRCYHALFKLLRAKQAVPDTVCATLVIFRAGAIKATLTAVNNFDAARVSVAALQPVKASKPDQMATTLALSVK